MSEFPSFLRPTKFRCILGWPKSSFGLFDSLLRENPNELFGQPIPQVPKAQCVQHCTWDLNPAPRAPCLPEWNTIQSSHSSQKPQSYFWYLPVSFFFFNLFILFIFGCMWAFSSCGERVWCTGLVASRHVGSSWTRARTRVLCIGWRILNHCATREAPCLFFKRDPEVLLLMSMLPFQ